MSKTAIFILLLLTSFGSYACSCQQDLKAQVNGAEKIFLAKAVSARLQNEADASSSHVEANLMIIRELKGRMAESTSVKTKTPGGDCGVPITIGQTYVIFLGKGTENIGMCDGSHELFGLETEATSKAILTIVRKYSN